MHRVVTRNCPRAVSHAAAAAAAPAVSVDDTASRGRRSSEDNVKPSNTTTRCTGSLVTIQERYVMMTLACRDVVSLETVGIPRRALAQRGSGDGGRVVRVLVYYR